MPYNNYGIEGHGSRISMYNSIQLVANQLPVEIGHPYSWRTFYRLVTAPLEPNDIVQARALIGVLNNTKHQLPPDGINVGVGAKLQLKDIDGNNTYFDIAQSTGENVDKQTHHLALNPQATCQLDSNWISGHRAAICVTANAHSTATFPGAYIESDPYGGLSVTVLHTD